MPKIKVTRVHFPRRHDLSELNFEFLYFSDDIDPSNCPEYLASNSFPSGIEVTLTIDNIGYSNKKGIYPGAGGKGEASFHRSDGDFPLCTLVNYEFSPIDIVYCTHSDNKTPCTLPQ